MISLWQQPQNFIGWCMLKWHQKFCKHEVKEVVNSDGIKYYLVKHVNDCGISLGKYIFLDSDRSVSDKSVRHEYGHQLQSKKLGWVYLIFIGLPSAIGNIYHRIFHKKWTLKEKNKWYYNQPWEKWADELGGVSRN